MTTDYNILRIIKLITIILLLVCFIIDNFRFNRKYRNRNKDKNINIDTNENNEKKNKKERKKKGIGKFLSRLVRKINNLPFNFSTVVLFLSILTAPVTYYALISQAILVLLWFLASFLLFGKNIEKEIKLPRLFKRKKLGKTKTKLIHFYNDSLWFYYILPIFIFIFSYSIGYYIPYGIYSLIISFQVIELELSLVIISLVIYLLFQLILLVKIKIKTKETFKYCIGMMNRGECKVFSFYPFMFLPFLALTLL